MLESQDAYCAKLVREADRDRYLATLFAAAEHRGALFALYAFTTELSRVREAARQPLAGEIRLKWWSEVLGGERREEARASPIADALIGTVERYRLPMTAFVDLIAARRFDLYDEPMANIAELDDYLRKTSSAVIALAARILGTDAAAAADPAGIAYGILGLLRAFAHHAAQGRLYLPIELLERHQASREDALAARPPQGVNAALAELRTLARRRLAAARERIAALPSQALPAFLPVALVRPSLDRLERGAALAPVGISAWRGQWLIWRAARNPARIAA
ncbi:MAG TPA: phytoene/squalene synthase family protein [Xanthobacteraceae bacterium]|nr:phytoene/squalene synthase family protein [Xanthobacteraceae bacterium]